MDKTLISANLIDQCKQKESNFTKLQKTKKLKAREEKKILRAEQKEEEKNIKIERTAKEKERNFHSFLQTKFPTTYQDIIQNIALNNISEKQLKKLEKQSFWWNMKDFLLKKFCNHLGITPLLPPLFIFIFNGVIPLSLPVIGAIMFWTWVATFIEFLINRRIIYMNKNQSRISISFIFPLAILLVTIILSS